MVHNDRVISNKLVVLSLVAATWLFAADFWQKKKYTQWSEKEARQMLTDSPWSRPVSIRVSTGARMPSGGGRGGGGRRGGGGGGAGAIDASMGSPGGVGGDSMGGRGGGGGMGGDMAGQPDPSVTAVVCWRSALPVKQAMVRLRFGDEAESSPDAARILAHEESSYVIAVAGLPPMAIRAKPDAIKSSTVLKVKGKDPVPVSEVRAERDQNRINLYLIFPRTPIELSDQEVEVEMKFNTVDIHRKFKLKDMMFDGKLQM